MDDIRHTVLDLQDRVYKLEQSHRDLLNNMLELTALVQKTNDTGKRLVDTITEHLNAQ